MANAVVTCAGCEAQVAAVTISASYLRQDRDFFRDLRTRATTKFPIFHYIYTKPNSPAPAKGYRAVW
jgi:hypothetical protein